MSGLPIRSFRQLAIGISVVSPFPASIAPAARTAVRAASTYKRYRQPKPELTKFPEGHGEQIWIYNHVMSNQVVYSHTPVLRPNRMLRQLPFNGKKTKPTKLRRDYWKPMALIQFDEGAGVVGRSVFQKLREFRRLHELSWGYQTQELYRLKEKGDRNIYSDWKLGRRDFGNKLNDQRANSIADMAAVLAGLGKGNRILEEADAEAAEAVATGAAEADAANVKLVPATIFWANEHDRNIAESWSKNVTHAAGIPSLESTVVEAEEAHTEEALAS